MLKLVIEKLEDVEEGLRTLYTKGGDGKYYLQTEEDSESKKKIQEFRDNNIKLLKEKEDLEKKFAGIDPSKVSEMQKKLQLIDDKQMIEAGKIDELVDQKVERMKADFEQQVQSMKTALEEKDQSLVQTNEHLSSVLIDSEITKAVTAVGGVRKDAMQDILSRGRRVWKLEEGKPIPKEGDKLLYGKDGKEALTFTEWATILSETAPFLFESSNGGGGQGNSQQTFSGGKVDWATIPAQERLKMIHADESKKQA